MLRAWGCAAVPAVALVLILGFGASAAAQQTPPRIIPWDEQLAPAGEQQPVDEPYAQQDAEDLAAGRAVRGYPRDEDDDHEPGASGRTVSGRTLLTPEERASFRSQFQQASPEQRQILWDQKRAELRRRAAERGVVLAEPWLRPGGIENLQREVHSVLTRLLGRPAEAP